MVVFDGSCGFCTRWARRLRERAAGTLEVVPSQAPGVLERAGLSAADAARAAWFLDGETRLAGAAAIAAAARAAGWRWPAVAFSLPGAGVAYSAAARARPLLSRLWADPPPYP